MSFKDNLRYLRKINKLNQSEFGDLIGKTGAAVSEYEQGRSNPTYEALIKIADYFDVKIDDLVRGDLTENQTGKVKTPPLESSDLSEDFDGMKYLIHDTVDNSFRTKALGEYLTQMQMKMTGKSREEVDAEIRELYEVEREKAKARVKGE